MHTCTKNGQPLPSPKHTTATVILLRKQLTSPRQVRLVPLSLRVREVISLCIVQRKTQLALVGADVVPHEVRVLGQVNGLEREFPEPLPPVDRGLRLRHDSA